MRKTHACGQALAGRTFSRASLPVLATVRLLEVVFLASLLQSGVALFLAPKRRPRWLRYQPALPITFALVHVFIEHGRWQLYGTYGLAGLISVITVAGMRNGDGRSVDGRWPRRAFALLIVAVTGASAAPPPVLRTGNGSG